MPKLYFTRAGADRITRQKLDLMDKLKDKQSQKGEAAEVGGNQWHDNFSFEQLMRDEQMVNSQIANINEKLASMQVVEEAPTDTTQLRIGHIAVLDVGGETKTYQIGGYEDSSAETDPPIVSYLAPVVRQFIGKEQGHVATVQIAGKPKQVSLEEIKPSKSKEPPK
jgi:transcription elongation GreA/GreB family factor